MGDIRLKIVANSAAEGEVKCRESDFPKFFASAHINVLRARERERERVVRCAAAVGRRMEDTAFSVQSPPNIEKVREWDSRETPCD